MLGFVTPERKAEMPTLSFHGSSDRIPEQSAGLDNLRLSKLNRLLALTWEKNAFYRNKWMDAGLLPRALTALEELSAFPLLTRAEIRKDQEEHPPLGLNLNQPASAIHRIHRSSGTSGSPIFWGDTPESWNWVVHCSRALFLFSGVQTRDRLFLALPFTGSSGPWIMHEGARALGVSSLTCGQSELTDQLEWIRRFEPTILVGRPNRLLDLAAAAATSSKPPPPQSVTKLILTGQASNAERAILEEAWRACCCDRYGLTEAGSVAASCSTNPNGLHVLETEFITESIDPTTGKPSGPGEAGELVVTNLGRMARPIVRYRTGDSGALIRDYCCPCGRHGLWISGGIQRLK